MNCLLGCSVEIPDQFFQIYCRFLGGWFSVDLAPFLRRFCTKGTIEDASCRSSPLYLSRKIKIMYGGTYRQKLGWRVVPSIYIRATHTYLFPTRAAFWNVMSKKRGWMFRKARPMTQKTMVSKNHGFQNIGYACPSYNLKKNVVPATNSCFFFVRPMTFETTVLLFEIYFFQNHCFTKEQWFW